MGDPGLKAGATREGKERLANSWAPRGRRGKPAPFALEEICARLARVLGTTPFEHTLQDWDESVPEGATVAVSVGVPSGDPCDGPEWSSRELVPRFGRSIASALETTVVHHRTWTGAGQNIARHALYSA